VEAVVQVMILQAVAVIVALVETWVPQVAVAEAVAVTAAVLKHTPLVCVLAALIELVSIEVSGHWPLLHQTGT